MATFAGKSNFLEIGSMPRRVVCNNRELEKKFGVSVQSASLLKEKKSTKFRQVIICIALVL